MAMNFIDGGKIAKQILDDLVQEVGKLTFQPLLCDIVVGNDPVALSYVNIKANRARKIGLQFELLKLSEAMSSEEVIAEIKTIQKKSNLAGLIVQLPLPANLDKSAILNAIDPKVDVDCLSKTNSDLFYGHKPTLQPPTAAAVMTILDSLPIDLAQLNILVVGQGDLVGRPVTFLLKQKGYQLSVADDSTNLELQAAKADVIISGAGQPNLIQGQMLKPGVVIIDCGTSESSGSIVGDVNVQSVASKTNFIAAVPGGVGPVTVARLLFNVVERAKEMSNV